MVEVWVDGYRYQVVFEGLCVISQLMKDTTTRLKTLCSVQYLCQPHIGFNHAALEFWWRRDQHINAVIEKIYACWKQRLKREIMSFITFKKEIKNMRMENADSFQDSPTGEINERFGQGCTKFHRSPTYWNSNSNFTQGVSV